MWLTLCLIKIFCLNKSKFSSALFKHGKEKKLSSISVLLSSLFWTKIKSSLWNSPKMLQNNRNIVCSYGSWKNIYTLLIKKLFKQIQIFQNLPLSNLVRKTNFLSFSVLVSEIVTFMYKKILYEFPQNALQKLSLQYVAHFVEKNNFFNIYNLLLVWSKTVV